MSIRWAQIADNDIIWLTRMAHLMFVLMDGNPSSYKCQTHWKLQVKFLEYVKRGGHRGTPEYNKYVAEEQDRLRARWADRAIDLFEDR